MATQTSPVTQREPELLGQTVVVIGGSAGIGLETARRARAEGADVILTARDPDRLETGGQPRSARDRTRRSTPTDFGCPGAVLQRAPGAGRPRDGHRPAAVLRAAGRDGLRRERAGRSTAHPMLMLGVARNCARQGPPGGTLLFMGGTGGRRPGGGCRDRLAR